MKKVVTITSRGEAQRLLCSGEVKELVGGNKVKYAFDPSMGVILADDGGWAAMLDCPWTCEIDVPDEAPQWSVYRACKDGEYSIIAGGCAYFGTTHRGSVSSVMAAAQLECDKRNAPKRIEAPAQPMRAVSVPVEELRDAIKVSYQRDTRRWDALSQTIHDLIEKHECGAK